MNLPDTLSALLRVALDDLKLCSVDTQYKLNMGSWHDHFDGSNCCYVCMAGAVMAKTMKVGVDEDITPFDIPMPLIRSKLLAINAMRTGDFDYAALHLGIDLGGRANMLKLFHRENDIPYIWCSRFLEEWELMYNKLVELGL